MKSFHCVCSSSEDTCLPPVDTAPSGCLSRPDCIVPVAVIAVVVLLAVAVLFAVVICVARNRHRRHGRHKPVTMMFSRADSTNPVFDLHHIDAQSATVSVNILNCFYLVCIGEKRSVAKCEHMPIDVRACRNMTHAAANYFFRFFFVFLVLYCLFITFCCGYGPVVCTCA